MDGTAQGGRERAQGVGASEIHLQVAGGRYRALFSGKRNAILASSLLLNGINVAMRSGFSILGNMD